MDVVIAALAVVASLLCAFFFGKVAPLSLSKINYFSFLYYYNVLVLCLVGVIFISLGWRYDDVLNLVSPENRVSASLYVMYGLVSFSIFIVFFSRLMGVDKKHINAYISTELTKCSLLVRVYFTGILMLVLLVAVYFFSKLDVVPIFEIMRGGLNVAESSKLRSDSVFDLDSSLNFIRMTATPVVQIVYFFFLSEFVSRKRFFNFFLVVISFLIAVLFLAYGGDKAPVTMFLLGHVFFYVLVNGRISIKILGSVLLLSLLLIGYLYASTMSGLSDSLLISFINRLFVSQVSGTYLAFQHYDAVEPFINFSSQNASILKLIGGEPALRASERLVEFYFTDSYIAGVFKNINSIFLHEAWANFGLAGAILSPIWVALLVCMNFYVLCMFGKSSVSVAFLTYFTYDTITFSTSFNAYIFSVQFVFLFCFFIVSIFLVQISRRVKW